MLGATGVVTAFGERGARALAAAEGRAWTRPVIVPLPIKCEGTAHPVVDLGSVWKFAPEPTGEFWSNEVDAASWPDVNVPGELVAQGFKIAPNSEYPIKRIVQIPEDFRGKKVLLRFDGVQSYARVWVNGELVRDHHCGFTSWDCDVTSLITPGKTLWITVGVTDRTDDISYASQYAKHVVAGIRRGVKMVALPPEHLTRLHAETDFDASYANAQLKVTAAFAGSKRALVRLRLATAKGEGVALRPDSIALTPGTAEATVSIPVSAPMKWDAEHPNLYLLTATLVVDGKEVETVEKKIGFRKIEQSGNRLLVNGQEVKLRGVCRHDVHPTGGRFCTPEMDERDVALFREANVNFVRTSHYPPSEAFLDACDRNGMYVEEETAVCFAESDRGEPVSTGDPAFLARYLDRFAEMIERDRSHACVLLWSLGNESTWGSNIGKEFEYVKQEEPGRPVIFSWPDSVPSGVKSFDVLSRHYPAFDADLRHSGEPALNDEYAHISCYNLETLRRDPGIRDFWGESIRRFWENCFQAEGCAGAAIWGAIDEVFLLPDGPAGYGEWGIIDGWRREKPEHWLTKKAYSPVRIADGAVANPGAGSALRIPVGNWFNHTDFRELAITWHVGGEGGVLQQELAPRQKGTLEFPARKWSDGEELTVEFRLASGELVDQFHLPIGAPVAVFPVVQGPPPLIQEGANEIICTGADFQIAINKRTGMIGRGEYHGATLIEGGPYLNLGAFGLAEWYPEEIHASRTAEEAVVEIRGSARSRVSETHVVPATLEIRMDGHGLITTNYTLPSLPKGFTEVGAAFELSSKVDALTWARKSLWSAYPENHIGRPKGTAKRSIHAEAEQYRTEPKWPWGEDGRNWFLFGAHDAGLRGTNDFCSSKRNIWHASCVLGESGLRVRAEANGDVTARCEAGPEGRVRMVLNNAWSYPDLEWGNYTGALSLTGPYRGQVRIRLIDSDDYTWKTSAPASS